MGLGFLRGKKKTNQKKKPPKKPTPPVWFEFLIYIFFFGIFGGLKAKIGAGFGGWLKKNKKKGKNAKFGFSVGFLGRFFGKFLALPGKCASAFPSGIFGVGLGGKRGNSGRAAAATPQKIPLKGG